MPQIEQVGIIGAGFIGRLHGDVAQTYGIAPQDICVLETDPDRRAQIEAGGMRGLYDLADFLRTRLDVIIIATPANQNLHVVDAVLNAERQPFGILLEKPVATVLADALEIERLIDESGAFLQCGFTGHFHPEFVAARQLIENEAIGEILRINEKLHMGGPDLPLRYLTPEYGGVILLNGVHSLDHLHFLNPDTEWTVQTTTAGFDWGMPMPDWSEIQLGSDHNQEAHVSLCWPTLIPAVLDDYVLDIEGTEGSLRIIGFDRVELRKPGQKIEIQFFHNPNDDMPTRHLPGLRAQFEAFCAAVQTGQQSPIPIGYGVKIQEMIEGINLKCV